ncbi:hypothetical protein [Massilia niastensis]|uniref:hypothetical protein n=1 Tax=Massilia niastensis TaxID=544911 RepID=UPI000374EFFD|nr:hypothetical protein [Massilia niastensis]
MSDDSTQIASTTAPVAAAAQSRDEAAPAAAPAAGRAAPHGEAGQGYAIGPDVTRTVGRSQPPQRELPLYRPLRIYTSDPSASRLEGAVTCVNVRYEPLKPGPVGRLFRVDNRDACTGQDSVRADLDSTYALLSSGYDPAPSDPRFHQQMVYAVCCNVYAAFRIALGRDVTWGFARTDDPGRLLLRPHAFCGVNAYYDKEEGSLCFGYAQAPDLRGAIRTLPGEYVFSCLSHDVIAHELTHAILDGLRSNFSIPSGPDAAAFHEAIADLIAIFQRLSYRELVRGAIGRARGQLGQALSLFELARQVGYASGCNAALREAIEEAEPRRYDEAMEAHALGNVLVAAVFDAFVAIYQHKTARYLRLATDGSGVLRPGELPPDLTDLLADKISALASQFQALVIRAIDYCPAVDIRFGEFLRALITADHDLVPDDPWGYREALIDAFLRRDILPRGVYNLSEHALLWRPPRLDHPRLEMLSFRELRFEGDPASPASDVELLRQARELGKYVAQPELALEFGLVPPGAPGFAPGGIGLPTVMSIRTARRIGPDRQIVFDLVAEVVQRCLVAPKDGGAAFPVYGGSTVILAPDGAFRYVISKSALGAGRVDRRARFLASAQGQRYWKVENGEYRVRKEFFGLLDAATCGCAWAPGGQAV